MTSTNNNAQATPEVANLHDTKRAQSAARKRHPAGRAAAAKVTAAKAASAKLAESMAEKPAKATAKKAPANKAAPVPAGSKLRWTHEGGERGNHTAQHAVTADGTKYAMASSKDGWTATVTPPGGKPVVLAAGVSGGKAYAVCVRHHREALAA